MDMILTENQRKIDTLKKRGIDPEQLGDVAAEVFTRIEELEDKENPAKKEEKAWYHPKEHWWDVSESENGDIPYKDQLPGPPRSLNAIDQSKYQMENFLHNGQLIEEKKNQAYEHYYSIKFKQMQQKQAVDLYQDYLTRIKSEYELKKIRLKNDKSQFSNFGTSLLCLPLKSRKRVKQKIEKRIGRGNQSVKAHMSASASSI